MLRNTGANGIQVTNAIFHSVDTLNKNTYSPQTMAQSVEHSNAARKVSGLSLIHSLLFDQNLDIYASAED